MSGRRAIVKSPLKRMKRINKEKLQEILEYRKEINDVMDTPQVIGLP